MSLAGFLERVVMGDKPTKDIKRMGTWGLEEYGKGSALSDEALAGFDEMDRGYSDRLRRGDVLDPSVTRAYSTLRGGIRDKGAGDRTATRASIAQQAAMSGGRLSPEQQAALMATADESVGQSEFENLSSVGVNEARDTMAAVNDLNDRIAQARGIRLQAGQFRMGAGQNAYMESIANRIRRNTAIASAGTAGASAGSGYVSQGGG